MTDERYRYFIELQSGPEMEVARRDYEARKAKALATIERLRNWLRDEGLEERVSMLGPTAFGQVQITCAEEVMKRIRDEEPMPIAAIRQGSLLSWVISRG